MLSLVTKSISFVTPQSAAGWRYTPADATGPFNSATQRSQGTDAGTGAQNSTVDTTEKSIGKPCNVLQYGTRTYVKRFVDTVRDERT